MRLTTTVMAAPRSVFLHPRSIFCATQLSGVHRALADMEEMNTRLNLLLYLRDQKMLLDNQMRTCAAPALSKPNT